MDFRHFHLNITAKFILFFAGVSILPLMLVGFAAYSLARDLVEDEATVYTQELVLQKAAYVDLQLAQIENLLANIANVEEITDLLEASSDQTSTYDYLATQAQIGYILNGYLNLEGLVSIDILTNGGGHFHVGDTLDVTEIGPETRQGIAAAVQQSDGPVTWLGIINNINVNSRFQQVVTAVRPISHIDKTTFEETIQAYILVNYDPQQLNNRFEMDQIELEGEFFIIDNRSHLIYHPASNQIGNQVSAAFSQNLQAPYGTLIDVLDDQEVVVSYAKSTITGWAIVSIVPRQNFTERTAGIRISTLVIVFSAILAVMVVSWLYNRDTVVPIREITAAFKSAREQPTQDIAPLTSRSHDEIGELVQWFNVFMETLRARAQEEEALRHTQKLESLGVLAGGIAHDFNNLLVAMMGQVSLAKRKVSADHPAVKHLEKAENAAERAADLTKQMLAYSGRGHFEIKPLSLNHLIQENRNLLQAVLPKHVILETSLDPNLPTFEGDQGQMQQLVMNLIINGAEAIGEHEGRVVVKTAACQLKSAYVHQTSFTPLKTEVELNEVIMFRVRDYGCGMSEETMVKIFDPFFTTKFTGRGLGLAAVLGIIQGHHGQIFVDSVEGEGTTITTYFPVNGSHHPGD